MPITLIANKPLHTRLSGRVARDEKFLASSGDAKSLIARGLARKPPRPKPPAPKKTAAKSKSATKKTAKKA